MANIIVVSFTEEAKAIEALHKIKELDAYGDITLYEHILIRKDFWIVAILWIFAASFPSELPCSPIALPFFIGS